MKQVLVLGAVTMMVAGACGPTQRTEASSGRKRFGIVGGTLDPGDPAVVALSWWYGGSSYEDYCTGTLIGPKTVLSAAHCMDYTEPNLFVVFGSTVAAPQQAIRIVQQLEHPDYQANSRDFGLVRLEHAPVGITPIPLNLAAMDATWVGKPIRHAGFGVTDAATQTGSGTKREVSYNLRAVRTWEIESGGVGKNTCQGDSGGPAFMIPTGGTTEVLVGVVSYGDASCVADGWDMRVDKAASWIQSTMAWETPSCGIDGQCKAGCTPADQDCVCAADGVCALACTDLGMDPDCPKNCGANGICATATCPRPDTDCVAVGATCTTPFACASRLCSADAQHPQSYCSQPCSAAAPCPTGLECAAASGECVLPQKPSKVLGEVCDPTTDFCAAGACTGPAGEGAVRRCATTCVDAAGCTGGAACESGRDGTSFCHPPGLPFATATMPLLTPNLTPTVGCSSGAGPRLLWALGLLAPLARRRRARTFRGEA